VQRASGSHGPAAGAIGWGSGATTVKLAEFKRWVHAEFGPNLEHATPANVREFLDRAHAELAAGENGNRFVLDEPATSYEEILRDFFSRVLDMPHDTAIMALWMLSLELSFAGVRDQWAERFELLFQGLEE
jgi:hypothetical protein